MEDLDVPFCLKGIEANVAALVNDTVGVLCATRYSFGPDANIAVVMGTGEFSNARAASDTTDCMTSCFWTFQSLQTFANSLFHFISMHETDRSVYGKTNCHQLPCQLHVICSISKLQLGLRACQLGFKMNKVSEGFHVQAPTPAMSSKRVTYRSTSPSTSLVRLKWW